MSIIDQLKTVAEESARERREAAYNKQHAKCQALARELTAGPLSNSEVARRCSAAGIAVSDPQLKAAIERCRLEKRIEGLRAEHAEVSEANRRARESFRQHVATRDAAAAAATKEEVEMGRTAATVRRLDRSIAALEASLGD